MLSQFSPAASKKILKDYFKVPHNVYPVGRLDYDSEGLLILTNDPSINYRLLNPSFAHEREYWVQVEGQITKAALELLRSGVDIVVDGKMYHTKKSIAEVFATDPDVERRDPPVRFRKNIPTSWIKLIITEGKNRQVRKMTAKAGFPTLRLIRHRIGKLTLEGSKPGSIKELTRDELCPLLFPA